MPDLPCLRAFVKYLCHACAEYFAAGCKDFLCLRKKSVCPREKFILALAIIILGLKIIIRRLQIIIFAPKIIFLRLSGTFLSGRNDFFRGTCPAFRTACLLLSGFPSALYFPKHAAIWKKFRTFVPKSSVIKRDERIRTK